MTEVLNADGTPHETNGRAQLRTKTMTFGLVSNRNIFSYDVETNLPVGFPKDQTLKDSSIVLLVQKMLLPEKWLKNIWMF